MQRLNTRIVGLIVATASLGAIIGIGLPWVDEYFELRRDMAEFDKMEVELTAIRHRGLRLAKMERELNEQLKSLNDRSVIPDNRSDVRERLVEIVRQGGGRIRSLEVHTGNKRSWATVNDDPTAEVMPEFARMSPYDLHSHDVDLRADGSLEAIEKILTAIGGQRWYMTTRTMNVLPTMKPEAPVALELRFTVFGLLARPDEPDEDVARRPTQQTRQLLLH
ncbi:hypothetical protein [Crateriforma conspicua]|uniref:Uncharacterized protein n=1 Tax=Crateriforma conspicua TaxID=2527996 RepID=A0A5C5YBB0_9PLAN|nr:hypothetical protein [Crateriforma conspicua]QDV61494.1 hypothetical protein Mal65_06190 [Crateriforma conspicua]TWT72259.1 hypothetical protein Pan14r_45770 [Crateriforma conspicua]